MPQTDISTTRVVKLTPVSSKLIFNRKPLLKQIAKRLARVCLKLELEPLSKLDLIKPSN